MSDSEKPELKKQTSMVEDEKVERFRSGVTIKGKFFGVEDVKQETGDEVCQNAMIKLKAIIAVKKEHKQKLNIKVDLEGIQILDETMNELYRHSVNRISYIARDLKDPRAIGYIYKNIDDSYQYFGLRTQNQAQELFNLLKDLFEVVLELRASKKNESTEETKPEEKKSEEKPTEAPLVSMTEPEKKPLQEPVVQAPVIAAPVAAAPEPPKPKEEPSLFDLSSDVVSTPAPAPAMDDLFGLGDLSLNVTPAPATTPVTSPLPTGNNDILAMLNANPTPSPMGVPQNQFNNAMFNQNAFTAMNGIPNMSQVPNMQQSQAPAGYNPQYGLNSLSQYQATASTIPAARTAPVPPAAPTNKVPTNAFDDLFN